MNQEILSIWANFHKHGLRYLTIGGFAVNIYGYHRNTADIDIYLEDTLENRINLRRALKDAGIGDFEEVERIQFLPGWSDFTLSHGLRLDVMTAVKGLEQIPFDELFSAANVVDIDGIPVRFIDYPNLILAKEAANRLKDQLDIEELRKVNG